MEPHGIFVEEMMLMQAEHHRTPRGSIYLSIYLSSWFRKLRPLRWLGWVVLACLGSGVVGCPSQPRVFCFVFFF